MGKEDHVRKVQLEDGEYTCVDDTLYFKQDEGKGTGILRVGDEKRDLKTFEYRLLNNLSEHYGETVGWGQIEQEAKVKGMSILNGMSGLRKKIKEMDPKLKGKNKQRILGGTVDGYILQEPADYNPSAKKPKKIFPE